MGDFYKLKAGSHTTGVHGDKDNPARHYSHSDPQNSIVESDQALDEIYPEKFDRYKGPPPRSANQLPEAYRQPKPPGPPTEKDFAAALMAKATTPQDKKEQAKFYRQQAEELEKAAQQEEQAQKEQEQKMEQLEQEQSDRMTEARAKRAQRTPNMNIEEPSKEPQPPPEKTIPNDDILHRMTVQQLRGVAEQSQVQMPPEAKRVDLINALKAARQQQEQQQQQQQEESQGQ